MAPKLLFRFKSLTIRLTRHPERGVLVARVVQQSASGPMEGSNLLARRSITDKDKFLSNASGVMSKYSDHIDWIVDC